MPFETFSNKMRSLISGNPEITVTLSSDGLSHTAYFSDGTVIIGYTDSLKMSVKPAHKFVDF